MSATAHDQTAAGCLCRVKLRAILPSDKPVPDEPTHGDAPMTFAFRTALLAASLLFGATVPSAIAAGPFDGTYAGAYTLTSSHNSICAAGRPGVIVVSEDRARIRFGLADMRPHVGPDGSFEIAFGGTKGYGGWTNIRGQIADRKIWFERVNAQYCSYLFEGTKR